MIWFSILVFCCVFLSSVFSKDNTIVKCDGETFHVSCGSGKVLVFTKAFYGREKGSKRCPDASSKFWNIVDTRPCGGTTALEELKRKCHEKGNNENLCNFKLDGNGFTNHCDVRRKYLKATYQCRPKLGPVKNIKKCKGEMVDMNCGSGTVVVKDAFYGRENGHKECGAGGWLANTKPCGAGSTTSELRNKCNGQHLCHFQVGTQLSNACGNRKTYFKASWQCKEKWPKRDIEEENKELLQEVRRENSFDEEGFEEEY